MAPSLTSKFISITKIDYKIKLERETGKATCDMLCRLLLFSSRMSEVKRQASCSSKAIFLWEGEGRGGTGKEESDEI